MEFLEGIGGIKEEMRHSRDPVVSAVSRDLVVDLKSAKPAQLKRKAPPLMLSLIVSLEELVMDTGSPAYSGYGLGPGS